MVSIKKIFLFSLLLLGINSAFARAKIPFGKKEVITVVSELPDNDMYETTENSSQYLDLATIHEEFNIAWILPLWITEDPKLVLYNENSETYYEVGDEEMTAILKENNIEKEDVLKVPFYNKYGGKAVLLLLIALIIWGNISKKENNVETKEL